MPDELTKSARRVFDILELFRERQCPLRLKRKNSTYVEMAKSA
jgi:hypothetical protein